MRLEKTVSFRCAHLVGYLRSLCVLCPRAWLPCIRRPSGWLVLRQCGRQTSAPKLTTINSNWQRTEKPLSHRGCQTKIIHQKSGIWEKRRGGGKCIFHYTPQKVWKWTVFTEIGTIFQCRVMTMQYKSVPKLVTEHKFWWSHQGARVENGAGAGLVIVVRAIQGWIDVEGKVLQIVQYYRKRSHSFKQGFSLRSELQRTQQP